MSSILDSPAAERNKDHIWGVIMNDVLPILMKRGNSNVVIDVLEIAGGTGVHTQHFAQRMQAVCGNSFTWLPSDPEEASRASIDARVKVLQDSDDPTMVTAASCVQRAISITLEETGPIEGDDILSTYDMIICINMIHISPWTATLGLMKIAKERLKNGGVLYCYGPFKEGGKAVESNLRFDEVLISRNPFWGVRNMEQVVTAAEKYGLAFSKRVEMPANNLSLIFVNS